MAIVLDDLLKGTVITSRIRLARNLSGYPFKVRDKQFIRDLTKRVYETLETTGEYYVVFASDETSLRLEAMKERHLISPAFIDNKDYGAAVIRKDESVSVMIGEEDLLREQCFVKGFKLREAYRRLSAIDDLLGEKLSFAFDKRFGFLTACPTNVGTGLRASVMLFLPGLTESGKMRSLIEKMKDAGLTVRGLYGEGSEAEGYVYQISNEVTLGVTEDRIISTVEDAVNEICSMEREETERLYLLNELQTMDKARKSFGILTNAVMLSYGEFLENIARVKLGALLGHIDISDIEALDDMTVSVRPYNLIVRRGKKLNPTERDVYRAEIVGEKLRELTE